MPGDFSGGPVVENPPSNAGDAVSIPGRETEIPHAARQLSPCTATREKPVCRNKEPVRCRERSCVPQGKTRHSQNLIN